MKKLLLGAAVLGLAFLLFGYYVGNTPEGKARQHEGDVIAMCWQDHQRKSLDDAAKRFIASTCEKLESEYRNKHGRAP